MYGKEKSNKCSLCGREFSLKSSLKTHELKHTTEDGSYKCTVCGKQFTLKASLKTHMLKHTAEVPYDCNVCGEVFKEKCDFRNHMETHTNEDRLEYPHCKESVLTHNEYIDYTSTASTNNSGKSCPSKVIPFEPFLVALPLENSKEISDTNITLEEKENFIYEKCVSTQEEGEMHVSAASVNDEHSKETYPTKIEFGVEESCVFVESVSTEEDEVRISADSLNDKDQGRKKTFKCHTCKDIFLSEESLKSHMVQELHRCEKCEKFYSSCHNLKLHKKCHVEKSIECKVCEKKFTTKKCLRRHELSHTEEQKCSFCEKKFANKKALKKHKKLHEQPKKRWECEHCGKILLSTSGLNSHSLILSGEQECSICTIKFPNISCLQHHLLNAHSEKKVEKKIGRKSQCHICGNMYDKSYMQTHLRIHAGEKNFCCDQCGMKFVSKTNLRGHKKVHTGEKRYKCDTCDKSFAIKKALVIHTRKHTGEKPYKCSVCSKAFVTSWSLKNHLRLHNLEEAFSCDICEKKFALKKSLYAHYAGNAHSKEELLKLDPNILNSISRKYECTICGKNCYEKTMLTFHMRTHTKEKPYKCTICGKSFRIKTYFKNHMKMHTGDLRFECTVCKKFLPYRWQVRKHELYHSGVKPHLCTICGKAFFAKNNLKLHIERHALEKKVYACSTCGVEFTVKRKCNTHQKSCSFGAAVTSQINECGSVEGSNIEQCYETLKTHELYHSEVKPHLCTICGKAFYAKNNLKLHIERHALEKKVYACSTCGVEFTGKRKYNMHQKSCSYGVVVTSQISECGSLEGSNIEQCYETLNNMNIDEHHQKNDLGSNTHSIQCSEHVSLDFDVKPSRARVIFSLREGVDSIKEDIVVHEIDEHEFCKRGNIQLDIIKE